MLDLQRPSDCYLLFLITDLKSRYQEKAFLDKPRPAGRSSAAPVSSAAPKKKHLIEAAPFGRLDQMLRTTVQGGWVWGGKVLGCSGPQPKTEGSGGQRPPSQKQKILSLDTVLQSLLK